MIEPAQAPALSVGPTGANGVRLGNGAFLGVLALVVLIETTGMFHGRRQLAQHDEAASGEALSDSP